MSENGLPNEKKFKSDLTLNLLLLLLLLLHAANTRFENFKASPPRSPPRFHSKARKALRKTTGLRMSIQS
jgi:hypothetical protein